MTDVRAKFEHIVSTHGAVIRRIARSYESRAPLADELVQDIYLAVWRALPKFREESSLKTFVARIAHNKAIDHCAREARSPRTTELTDDLRAPINSPEDSAEARDLKNKLLAAVQTLPISLKAVATLTLEGFSLEEIADVLGLSESATSVRLHRAKSQLQLLMRGSHS